jgi:hypothetical protein
MCLDWNTAVTSCCQYPDIPPVRAISCLHQCGFFGHQHETIKPHTSHDLQVYYTMPRAFTQIHSLQDLSGTAALIFSYENTADLENGLHSTLTAVLTAM